MPPIVIFLLLAAASTVSLAQTLHAPTRSVYKCTEHGRTSYSDAPCLGAERLHIEPSRGVGKAVGPDVQRERHREMLAEAVRPLTGMDAQQLDIHGRRMKLSVEAQRECRSLDALIPKEEGSERRADGEQRHALKASLFNLRLRQRNLRC
jgi:hypothetical protein